MRKARSHAKKASHTAHFRKASGLRAKLLLQRAGVAGFAIVFAILGVWFSGLSHGATLKHLTAGWYPADSSHYLSGTIDALPYKPQVVSYYTSWSQLFAGTAFQRSFVHAAAQDGVATFIELEPWDDTRNPPSRDFLANIANGSSDAQLRAFGAQVAAEHLPVWITFAHEMNGGSWYPWNLGGSEHATPSTWIKAWNRVTNDVDAGAGSGRSLISWVWAPNFGPPATFSEYFSNNGQIAQNVNIMGLDGYLCHNQTTGTCTQTYSSTFTATTHIIRSLRPNLPLVITETGVGGGIGTRAAQITDLVRGIRADPANVTGVLWFNEGGFIMTNMEKNAWASVLTNG